MGRWSGWVGRERRASWGSRGGWDLETIRIYTARRWICLAAGFGGGFAPFGLSFAGTAALARWLAAGRSVEARG